MNHRSKYLLLALLAFVGVKWLTSAVAAPEYRVVVADDRLYAIEHGGSYGMERRVLATDDLGVEFKFAPRVRER